MLKKLFSLEFFSQIWYYIVAYKIFKKKGKQHEKIKADIAHALGFGALRELVRVCAY